MHQTGTDMERHLQVRQNSRRRSPRCRMPTTAPVHATSPSVGSMPPTRAIMTSDKQRSIAAVLCSAESPRSVKTHRPPSLWWTSRFAKD